jgi:mono/diheme cytochrome c family protein
MLRSLAQISFAFVALLFLVAVTFPLAAPYALPRVNAHAGVYVKLTLQETRRSTLDLEVAGDLPGVPVGVVRYLPREELLRLPQVSAKVSDDGNFRGPTQISGVLLEVLTQSLSARPQSDLVVAISNDKYRTNYSRGYIAAHHPILVLTIDGKPPDGWPKDPQDQNPVMGPYLISHARFTPVSTDRSYADEPQIPWGVIRLEFRDEEQVFGSIAPRGAHADEATVQMGYHIAEQNCFHCHNMGDEGGQKAGRSWLVLATWAAASPEYFSAYIRDPKSKNPRAQMPGNPAYDDTTLQALVAYFRTFGPQEKP